MKPRIIAIASQKGGVGKTTTAHALGWLLSQRGRRVLMVDLDPQSSLTAACGLQAARADSGDAFGPGAGPDGALRALLQEAKDSGDPHRLRATTEVLRGLKPVGATQETRIAVEGVRKQAERDLQELRTTPEMTQAVQACELARAEMLQKHEELRRVGETVDSFDPANMLAVSEFAKAYRRIGVENNRLIIRKPDDPEVTGVIWDKESVK